jgi:hypothetical protein
MLAAAPLLLLGLLPQGQDEVLATFVLEGKPATVTAADAALEMAHHLRRRDRGRETIAHLVDATLIREAAVARDLMPKPEEAQAYWRELQRQMRAAGSRPEDVPAVRNTPEREWLAQIAVQMAHERVVRAELGLSEREPASKDMLTLWLQERRKKARIVDDPDALPAGVAVRVGDTAVPVIEFGLLLLRTAKDHERQETIGLVALLATLEAAARREGFEVTAHDLDVAVQQRREAAARDPTRRGATFENLLEAQGLTIAALRDLHTFRAHVLLDKLAARRFPAAELAKELEQDREAVLERVGPRRRLALIFVRAADVPNALIPRDFAEATAHLATLRELLAKETFEKVARLESDHNATKMQGGDAGWHHRRSERLPEPVLAAAFALPPGEVSTPIRTDDGCFLVKVVDVEPVPADDVLLQRLREEKAIALRQQLLADSKLEIVGAAKPGAGAGK